MNNSGFLLCVVLVMLNLPAQAVAALEAKGEKSTERATEKANDTKAQQAQQAQRRNALRSALAQRKKSDDAIEAKLVDRHLTAQERDEMRQQLRQQRREAELAKP